jgi:glyceraldehyde 3-phosphate dehydrogenase
MSIRIAINGFGRIGRLVFRALAERDLLGKAVDLVAINDLVAADNLAYLLRYDSVQGRCHLPIQAQGDTLQVNGHIVQCLAVREGPRHLPWKALGVDIVIEATGLFNEREKAMGHLDSGARKVLITAPAKGDVKTIVIGVNEGMLKPDDLIVSNASCTTNCLAPMAKVVLDHAGIEEGLMTTVHSYTATQKTVDGPSGKDWKGGRAAALNIIPASTGAAKAVALVIPELKGKLTGMAFRVPTPTVSVVDLTVRTSKPTSYQALCKAFKEASQGSLKGIMEYTEDEVVSSDFIHNPASCIFDAGSGIQLNECFFKLVGWYDNEWGYSQRCVDLLQLMAKP